MKLIGKQQKGWDEMKIKYKNYPPWLLTKVKRWCKRKIENFTIDKEVLENSIKILQSKYHQKKWDKIWKLL